MKGLAIVLLSAIAVLAGGCTALGGLDFLSPDSWTAKAPVTDTARAYTHYLTSVVHERAGQDDQTIEHLNKVVALDPGAVTPTVRLVRAYQRRGKLDDALRTAKEAVNLAPDRADLWILLGEVNYQARRIDDALTAFNKAIELRPDDMLGYGALVEVQESTNDLVAAIDVYQKLIQRNPDSAAFHFHLALNLMRIKDNEAAIAAFHRVLELEPRVVRARYMLGLLYVETGRMEEGAAQFQQYLEQRAGDVSAQEYLAGAWSRLGRYAEAADLFQQILSGKEAQPKHYLQAAWLMLMAGKPSAAIPLATQSGSPVLAGLFTVLANQAMGVDAVREYAGLDAIEGDVNEECDTALADVLYLFGQKETSARLIQMLQGLPAQGNGPSRVLAFVQARALMYQEDYAGAVTLWNELLKQAGEDKSVHYHLATCYEKLKDPIQVETHLKAYLAIDPEDPEVQNFLGYYYADNNIKLKEAESLIKRALKAEPDSPFYLDSLGWVYYRMGRHKESLDLIRRALYGMDNDDAVLREHLGDVHFALGDVPNALSEWQRALRLDPKSEAVRKKIEANTPKP